jgi:tetratricopeptide (TPR) repeat protein
LDSYPSDPAKAHLDSALYNLQQMEYDKAEAWFASPTLKDEPSTQYFRGLMLLQRFEDRGDTLDLYRADSLWPTILQNIHSPSKTHPSKRPHPTSDTLQQTRARTNPLLEGLTLLQWAGTQQKRGKQWKAIQFSMKARKILATQGECPEAKGALALMEYYRDQLLPKWLPGGGAALKSAENLKMAAEKCGRLKPLFLGAWVWTQFDHGQWKTGLEAIHHLLRTNPDHRLYLQMKGDFQFRQGDLAAAKATYQHTLSLYPKPSRTPSQWHGQLPLGYLACHGNLARIGAGLGQKEMALEHLAIWEDPLFHIASPWLPQSLIKALKPLRQELSKTPPSSHLP